MTIQETQAPQSVEPGRPWDAVRWGPVWAGLLTTLGVFLVLELLAYGIGLLTVTNSDGSVSASGASPWITGVLGLIAFFSLVLSAIAAALGGMLGSIGRATGHLRGRMSACGSMPGNRSRP